MLAGRSTAADIEFLGDSRISITMNTYSHISEAQSRAATDHTGELFQILR
jgi:hypothetical protein